jgi:hypothetical protein
MSSRKMPWAELPLSSALHPQIQVRIANAAKDSLEIDPFI